MRAKTRYAQFILENYQLLNSGKHWWSKFQAILVFRYQNPNTKLMPLSLST